MSDPEDGLDDGDRKCRPKGDYAVGYCRPPVANRFSATNRGGRPRGTKNLATVAREKLNARITVREKGKNRSMTKAELGVTKLVNKFAETGDLKAFLLLSKLVDPAVPHSGENVNAAAAVGAAPTREEMTAWAMSLFAPRADEGGGDES